MDGAGASGPYLAVAAKSVGLQYAATSKKVAAVSSEALRVGVSGAAVGADLGGSSKYSNENFEGRSGDGFHVNSS